jgi:hypothetical protein
MTWEQPFWETGSSCMISARSECRLLQNQAFLPAIEVVITYQLRPITTGHLYLPT